MKVISFLGTARYEVTQYAWQGETYTAAYAPAAAAHFLGADEVIILLTPQAQKMHQEPLRSSMPKNVQITTCSVPAGGNEEELWEIFIQITESVHPAEKVGFDVTHGYRSLPMLGLMAAAFLQAGLDVTLEALLYGAWEARDETFNPPRTPMYDLSPMLALLSWADAARRFNRAGDARDLAQIVKAHRKQIALSDHPQAQQRAGWLGNLAGALQSISNDLRLIRPDHALTSIAELPERMAQVSPILCDVAELRPFDLLFENIQNFYRTLIPEIHQDQDEDGNDIESQRLLIGWYAQREQWVQAVTLGREWLVSWALTWMGTGEWRDPELRQQMERALGASASGYREAKIGDETFQPLFLGSLPEWSEALDIWSTLSNVRNDIDHAGMRPNPLNSEHLIEQIQKLVERLQNLPLKAEPSDDISNTGLVTS